jgi:hypothetical protein
MKIKPIYQFFFLDFDHDVVSDVTESFDVFRHSSDAVIGVADGVGDGEGNDDLQHVEAGEAVRGQQFDRNNYFA